MRRFQLALFAALSVAACDPASKSGAPVTAASATGSTAGAPSQERETCAATADCENGLRCVESTCRKPTSSRLGDYYWVAGDLAAAKGDYTSASVSYQQAMGQFEAEKLGPPPALLCAYGRTLRHMDKDPKSGEQAARLLHRCVLSTPAGAADYRAAMADLVALEDKGLDPALLARSEPADTYLTRTPKKMVPDKPVLEIGMTNPAKDKGYQAFVDATKAQEAALGACWKAYVDASQKTTLTVPVDLKYRVTLGDDDIVVGAKLDATTPAGLSGADAAAATCVSSALAPVVADFGKNLRLSSGGWQGAITITLRAAQ